MKQTVQYSCLFLAAYATGAVAQPRTLPEVPEGDTLMPYIYTGATYDNNIFRVADEGEARENTGSARMSDTVTRYGLGVRMHKPISLQTLRLDAAIERANYQHFDNLDHTAGAGLLAWDWEVGRVLDGTLSHSYTRSLSDFNEFQRPVRDIRDVNLSHFSGGMNFLTAWRLELGGESRSVRYDEQTFLDRDEDMGFAELLYATSVNTRVGLRAQHTDADLEPQPRDDTFINNDYEENEYSLVMGWEGSAKSYLEARAGYTRRDQDDPAQSDFSGATGRLTHQWEITPITQLRTSVYRNTNALDYQIATFVVTEGAWLEPIWQITPDTRLVTRLGYQRDEFEGPVVDVDGTEISDAGREDKVASAGTAIEYAAITDLLLRLGVEHRDRNSNREDSDYDYTQVSAELSYAF